jgi:flagellar motility protein MotE (MotC chaperone)
MKSQSFFIIGKNMERPIRSSKERMMSIMPRFFVGIIFLATVFIAGYQVHAEENPAAGQNPSQATSVEQRRILSRVQEAQTNTGDEQKGLTMREKELKTLNEEVDKKLGDINQKLEELKTLQQQLKDLTDQRDAEELARRKDLAKIYEKMAPDKAAFALANMDDKLATDILANMKAKSAAKILDVLDRKKASELSTAFSTLK